MKSKTPSSNTKSSNKSSTTPTVTVLCPTFNRHSFLHIAVYQFQYQDYPKDRMDMIILDDTPSGPWEDAEEVMKNDPRVKYIYSKERYIIPKKRNTLNDMATGDIIVCMDDDDYYPPTRVKHVISKLTKSTALIAGSSELLIYDCKTEKGYKVGPYGGVPDKYGNVKTNHGTNGSFGYRRELLKDHRYDDTQTNNYAEEKYFLKDFTTPMVQLNPYDTIICFNHSSNTFDKTPVLAQQGIVRPIQMDLRKLIKDTKVYEFFSSLRGRDTPQSSPGVQD